MLQTLRGPVTLCLLVGALAIIPACGSDSTPTSPRAPGGVTVPVVTLRIEITAPAQVAPGQSVQLTAQAVKNDGSREDVTSRTLWTSNAGAVLGVTDSGLASGVQAGEAMVTARADSLTATTRVLVLPAGTFLLSGMTTEYGAPVDGVDIEVVEGIGTGMKTTSRADGTYALYGVAGQISLHVKRDGYINTTESLTVASNTTRDLSLAPERTTEPYTGTYTMTVTAVAPCFGGELPSEARRRVYTAQVLQRGSSLRVTLADADFIITRGYGNSFQGTTALGTFNFDLRKYDWYYYRDAAPEFQVVERLSGNLAVVLFGTAEASGSTSRLNGRIQWMGATSRMTSPHEPMIGSCRAEFEMVRR